MNRSSLGAVGSSDCPRCGREVDLSSERIAAIVAETPIAPSLAAEEELYQKRLSVCGACDALREAVLCAHCGCFVLFRARPKKSYCPHPKGDLWEDIVL
jgi:DNA-directed RNA polymerase subunit RPC12/RpoP